MDTRLLILDINGVLCCKIANQVVLRPDYKEFLSFCFDNFTVAFFSSTTYKNANAIINKLLSSEQRSKVAFFWYRDRTRKDHEMGGYSTIKNLIDVFDNPVINKENKYNKYNTLICDDSPTKLRFNDEQNVIIVQEFKGDKEDQVLHNMIKEISSRFEELI